MKWYSAVSVARELVLTAFYSYAAKVTCYGNNTQNFLMIDFWLLSIDFLLCMITRFLKAFKLFFLKHSLNSNIVIIIHYTYMLLLLFLYLTFIYVQYEH